MDQINSHLPESCACVLQRSLADSRFISLKLFLFASPVARADSGRVAPARAVCRLTPRAHHWVEEFSIQRYIGHYAAYRVSSPPWWKEAKRAGRECRLLENGSSHWSNESMFALHRAIARLVRPQRGVSIRNNSVCINCSVVNCKSHRTCQFRSNCYLATHFYLLFNLRYCNLDSSFLPNLCNGFPRRSSSNNARCYTGNAFEVTDTEDDIKL